MPSGWAAHIPETQKFHSTTPASALNRYQGCFPWDQSDTMHCQSGIWGMISGESRFLSVHMVVQNEERFSLIIIVGFYFVWSIQLKWNSSSIMMQCQCGSILIMVGYQSICFSNPVLTFCIRAKPRMHVGGSVPPPLKVAYTRLSSCKINRYSQPFTTWVLIKFSLLLCYVAGGKKASGIFPLLPCLHTHIDLCSLSLWYAKSFSFVA